MNQAQSGMDNWFVCPKTNSRAEMRIFLFPYAGGSPALFRDWSEIFPNQFETQIIHYPGRGSRYNEPRIKRISALVESISRVIQSLLDRPFAFFGHSLGGLVAFELARYLYQNHAPQPNILFVSGCRAPHLPAPEPPIHTLPDPEFLEAIRELNGTPVEFLEHTHIINLLLPTLRADFEIVETYQFTPSEHVLSCPIVAFGGLDDPQVSQKALKDWYSHTNAGFKLQYFPGDHFFINHMKEAVTHSITKEMIASSARKQGSG